MHRGSGPEVLPHTFKRGLHYTVQDTSFVNSHVHIVVYLWSFNTERRIQHIVCMHMQVDERRMLSREVTNSRNSHPNSPSEALAALALSNGGQTSRFDESEAFSLVRQGSMNLPLPEDSGVPSTHPDMCIVRIRRNHLVEVA